MRLPAARTRIESLTKMATSCLVLVLTACAPNGPVAPAGGLLPRHMGDPPHYGAAAIEGTLVEERGCLELTKLSMSAEFAPPAQAQSCCHFGLRDRQQRG